MIARKTLFVALILLTQMFVYAIPVDEITKIQLNVYPKESKIKTGETAVLHAEFFGTKKKGLFDSLFGENDPKVNKLGSSKWKIEIVTPNGGLLSKPFKFQKEGETTKGGFENFLNQGLGAISSKDSVLYTPPSNPGKYKIRLTEGNLTSEVVLNVTAGISPTEEKTSFSHEELDDKYSPIVTRYAPFVAQETWFNPRADYLGRFDFDGNWKGDDNWENLESGSSQAFVYYAVMETATHWFLHYNFFHPRDYSDACVVGTCHENDNEGLILAVRKDGSEFGRLEMMETLAHNNIYTFTNQKRIKKKVHNVDGKIRFYKESHPIVFVEAGGHGVIGSEYRSSLFDSYKMAFRQNTGITYEYKDGVAERPKHGNDRNVGYALIPIEKSWWDKGSGETDAGNDSFESFFVYKPYGGRPQASKQFIAGAFKGRTASDSKAKPFWGWHDRKTRKKRVLNTGQWALDPAYSLSICYKWPKDLPVSTDYIYNPFLKSFTP